jgi:hypothetical protein
MQEVAYGRRMSPVMETVAEVWVDECPRDMQALERALLRHGVENRNAARQRCSGCHRTPLIGERIYLTHGGPVLCELCRARQGEIQLPSRVVREPGAVIRIVDQRSAWR